MSVSSQSDRAQTPELRASDVVERLPRQLFIGGEWRDGVAGATFPVEDPATEEVIASIADGDADDARSALDAAAGAQAAWAATAPRDRGNILRRAFDIVTDRADDAAHLMTLEMGKPLSQAHEEVTYGADFLQWYAEEAVRINGRYTLAPSGGTRILTTKRPVGPCLLITPWNFPLAMATRKVGAALAAGCTAILKPASQTPLTAVWIAKVFEEAGVPAGVLNLITSFRARATVGPLFDDPRLRKVSFTGSTEVGRELVRSSAPGLLRTSMELGGNAAFVVLADADVDAAVSGALVAKLRNMGQSCTAANRFIVAREVVEEFSTKLAAAMGDHALGHGLDPDTAVGPLIDGAQRERLGALVDDARSRGATVTDAGRPLPGRGYFYPPSVVRDVPRDSRLLHEEIFGPVAPVIAFDTREEAISLANATEYGLAAFVFTRDLDQALECADELDTGMVGINRGVVSNAAAPFGGIKASGFGREGGPEGLEEYLSLKYISI